jgi:hypothetical protein
VALVVLQVGSYSDSRAGVATCEIELKHVNKRLNGRNKLSTLIMTKMDCLQMQDESLLSGRLTGKAYETTFKVE